MIKNLWAELFLGWNQTRSLPHSKHSVLFVSVVSSHISLSAAAASGVGDSNGDSIFASNGDSTFALSWKLAAL
jgi:hypothetical protein